MKPKELTQKWIQGPDCLFVLYDNAKPPKALNRLHLEKGWGFSAAIKYNRKKILFDCGWSGSVLRHNMKALNIPNSFDYIIISHKHWDHTGGLSEVVENNPDAEVFLPSDFSDHLTRELEERTSKVYRFHAKDPECPYEITEGLFVTGGTKGRGGTGEQAAIVRASEMNLLIVGCLHPGLRALYRLASKALDPNGIIGGIHGFKDTEYLMSTGLRKLFIGHCTQHLELFEGLPAVDNHKIYPGFYLEL